MEENERTEQAAHSEESFDELIQGRHREAFAAKLREILSRQAQAQKQYLDYQRLRLQEAQARQEHPELSLCDELENADFVRLLQSGVGLKTAYEAVHHRELLERQAEQRLEELQKLARRPVENAVADAAAAKTEPDVAHLSARERRALRRRAERGEKITF